MHFEDASTRDTFNATPFRSSASRHAAAGLFRPRGDNNIPETLCPPHHQPSVAPCLEFELASQCVFPPTPTQQKVSESSRFSLIPGARVHL
ncbi:hypothetical protein AHAS_Ahas02G0077800 [Arachis hypogaea]